MTMRPLAIVLLLSTLFAATSCATDRITSPIASPIAAIRDIEPADIESIEVLKGAAAAAVYGKGCTASIIVITRRKGSVAAPELGTRAHDAAPRTR